jgi:hypothetical protein
LLFVRAFSTIHTHHLIQKITNLFSFPNLH